MLYHLKGCTWKQGFVSMVWFCDIRAGRTFQCLPAILLACIHNLWLLHSSVCVSTPTCLLLAHTERRVVFLKLQHQPVKPSKRIILKGHNSDYFGKWSSFLLLLLPPSSARYTEVQRVNMLQTEMLLLEMDLTFLSHSRKFMFHKVPWMRSSKDWLH